MSVLDTGKYYIRNKHVRFVGSSKFIKIGANFGVRTKFARIYNFGSRSSIPSTIFIISMLDLLQAPNFIKNWSTFQFWNQICNFGSGSSIPIIIFIISMFDLFWVTNFIKIGYIAILRPNLPKFLIPGQDPQF